MSERIWPDGKTHPEHPSGKGYIGGFGPNHAAQPGWSLLPKYVAPFPPPEPKPAKKAAEHPSGPFPDVDMRVRCGPGGCGIQQNRVYLRELLEEMKQLSARITRIEKILCEHNVMEMMSTCQAIHRLEEKN